MVLATFFGSSLSRLQANMNVFMNRIILLTPLLIEPEIPGLMEVVLWISYNF